MLHCYCGERIKLDYTDLNSRIDEYHTGVVGFLNVILARKKNVFAPFYFFPAPDGILQIFQWS